MTKKEMLVWTALTEFLALYAIIQGILVNYYLIIAGIVCALTPSCYWVRVWLSHKNREEN